MPILKIIFLSRRKRIHPFSKGEIVRFDAADKFKKSAPKRRFFESEREYPIRNSKESAAFSGRSALT
ncbi:hypothetical protein [Leptospira alexanderi]|uniref:hypothetical protein n=1 Tax=Leptospira alexanderi TaxID=100053 RepID=UPI000990E2DD|nr:hypothetical protein [Leptospira alexanderi]